jgi:hypothetical protein
MGRIKSINRFTVMAGWNLEVTSLYNSIAEKFQGIDKLEILHYFSCDYSWTIDFAYSFVWSSLDNSKGNYLISKLTCPQELVLKRAHKSDNAPINSLLTCNRLSKQSSSSSAIKLVP